MLTVRQKAFVEAFVVLKNASESARRAGYSPKTAGVAGAKLVKHPEVKKAIEAHFEAEKAELERIKRERSKTNFVEDAYTSAESLPIDSPLRPRYLDLAGRALGFLRDDSDKRPNQTLIVNVDASKLSTEDKLAKLRALLDSQ